MNITYLLGAGASANCLPVMAELPIRLRELLFNIQRATIQNNPTEIQFKENKDRANALQLCKDIEWLLKELRAHTTIDTLAKKFYLQMDQQDSLVLLKKIMIAYFYYEQAFQEGMIRPGVVKQLPDKRYDSLIATIIDKKRGSFKLPNNFKIITWNYDFQFELAYRVYLPALSMDEVQKKLGVFPTKEFFHDSEVFDINKFSLIRLNGVAGLNSYVSRVDNVAYDDLEFANLNLLTAVVRAYSNMSIDEIKAFNYSWEVVGDFNLIFERKSYLKDYAKKIILNTDVLVIIGYSFPNFNRSVDKDLFKNAYGLKRIYIQDANALAIEDLLRSVIPILQEHDMRRGEFFYTREIKTITETDQFFIPPEAEF